MKSKQLMKVSADYINDRQNLINVKGSEMINLAIEIGEELIKVKSNLKHGEFGNWCEENISVGKMQRSKYMRLAEGKSKLDITFTAIDDAVKFLSDLSKPKTKKKPEVKPMPHIQPDPQPEPEIDFKERLDAWTPKTKGENWLRKYMLIGELVDWKGAGGHKGRVMNLVDNHYDLAQQIVDGHMSMEAAGKEIIRREALNNAEPEPEPETKPELDPFGKRWVDPYENYFTYEQYRSLVSLLHADKYQGLSDAQKDRMGAMFNLVKEGEEYLSQPKPRPHNGIPDTVEELIARRKVKH